MADQETQHLIIFDDQGRAIYSLINNHGPLNAAAFLYGHPGEPGCVDRAEQDIGRPGSCIVVDVDFGAASEKEKGECMRQLTRCRAAISGPQNARSVGSIDFFSDDDFKAVRRSLPAQTNAKIIEAPNTFAGARYDVRGVALGK